MEVTLVQIRSFKTPIEQRKAKPYEKLEITYPSRKSFVMQENSRSLGKKKSYAVHHTRLAFKKAWGDVVDYHIHNYKTKIVCDATKE
jgi:hypothetical protein